MNQYYFLSQQIDVNLIQQNSFQHVLKTFHNLLFNIQVSSLHNRALNSEDQHCLQQGM